MKLLNILVVAALAAVSLSCSDKKTSGNSTETSIDVSEFTGSNAVASSSKIDSLALEADFLTPEQGVNVLVGLSEIVKAEQEKGKSSKKLEYMRKYIDTYDILADRSEEFRQTLAEAGSTTGIDLAAIFRQYREVLSNEADGTAIEGEDGGTTQVAAPAKADSSEVKAESVSPAPADSVI